LSNGESLESVVRETTGPSQSVFEHHVWDCFSSKAVGPSANLLKHTARNKEWYKNILQEQLLPKIQEHFDDGLCIFQSRVIMRWLGDNYIEILDL